MKELEVIRVINNNVILVRDINKSKEFIYMGKGIGFGVKGKKNIRLSSDQIEKSFTAGDGSLKNSYLDMLKDMSPEIVDICIEIVSRAEDKLGKLSDRSFIVIADHISFAIEKINKGITIANPFVLEIQQLYPDEYAIGDMARRYILEKMTVDIGETEAGFIGLHLHSAKENTSVTQTLKTTRLIKDLADTINTGLNIDLNKYPYHYNRLLQHLRGLLIDLDKGRHVPFHPLFDQTIKECPKAYTLAQELTHLINKEKNWSLEYYESFYLTLHIDRIIRELSDHSPRSSS